MSEPDSIVLQVLAELRSAVDQTVNGLAELKATQRVHGNTLDRVLAQTTETNGRLRKAEGRLDQIERREIREDGIADGRAEQRQAYRSAFARAWKLIWSPMGKGAGALALLLTGWTLREVLPW